MTDHSTVQKYYVSYNNVHKVCQNGADKIKQDGFEPDVILAIGGGGFVPARMIRTHLRVPMKAVSLELYDDKTDKPNDTVKTIQWIDSRDVQGKNVLIVDEIDDTRTTLAFCVEEVKKMQPNKIGVFVLHNKLKEKRMCAHWKHNSDQSGFQQQPCEVDYYCAGEEIPDVWIVYPWESDDIDSHTNFADQCSNSSSSGSDSQQC